jgi:hypothetical protein
MFVLLVRKPSELNRKTRHSEECLWICVSLHRDVRNATTFYSRF